MATTYQRRPDGSRCGSFYSERNATSGSRIAARRAGTNDARRQMPTRSLATDAWVAGSKGLTPTRRARSSLCQRPEHRASWRLPHRLILARSHHADHFQRGITNGEAPTDRTPVRPELARQGVVHDHHWLGCHAVAIVERSSFDDWHARGGEVLPADIRERNRCRLPIHVYIEGKKFRAFMMAPRVADDRAAGRTAGSA